MILIDPPTWEGWETTWSHLVSDVSIDELHEFAERVGLPRRLFDLDHYDVPVRRYDAVVTAGGDGTISAAAEALTGSGRALAPMTVFHGSITYLTVLFVALAIDPFVTL